MTYDDSDTRGQPALAADPAAFQAGVLIPVAGAGRRFGDVMADFQRERFAAINPALLAVAAGERPRPGKHWWEAVKGNSKTTDLAVVILWLLTSARRPLLVQIGAADRDQAGEIKKAAVDILRLNRSLDEDVKVQTSQMICPRTESKAEILAADVVGSHGARPDVLVLDEVVHVRKTEFLENLLDNASKIPHCLTVVATNAGFTGSWAWRFRELARNSDRWSFHRRTEPSPWVDRTEIDEARARNTPSRFDRLWGGVWSSGNGDAISETAIDASIVLAGPVDQPRADRVYVGGLDLGVKKDHSAFLVLECDGRDRRVRLARCFSWAPTAGQVDLIAVRDTIALCHRVYGLRSVRFDPNQALLMAQELQKEGVSLSEMPFAGTNLNRMASAMIEAFRSGRIELYRDERLIGDLKKLTIVEDGFGMKLEAPSDARDGHCDRAFALATCLPHALELANDDTTTCPEILPIVMGSPLGATPLLGARGLDGGLSPRQSSSGGRDLPGFGQFPFGHR
ncbi:MAG TPA: terminase large subunit [Pirellulales bacterium]|nr:terminase large subunit [Pirellulales bacterium]